MSDSKLTEKELLQPTQYRYDHGTMTMAPEKTIPTMSVGQKGYPTVFMREGRFYSQSGEEFDFAGWPGGYEALIKHVKSTVDRGALRIHGFTDLDVPEKPATSQVSATEEAAGPLPKNPIPRMAPVDMSGDPDLVYETIGDNEMDLHSIEKVSGIHEKRVRMALDELGNRVEKIGEGKRGSPYLYRRAMPTD